jgi:hypothetical protein
VTSAIDRELDPLFFPRRLTWSERLAAFLYREGTREPRGFLRANARVVDRTLSDGQAGVRMVVNVPADALLGFLNDGSYKNAYQRPVVAGRARAASNTRKRVDKLLGFGRTADRLYFGAAALGGSGIRFYGSYCLVLRADRVTTATGVFDRNSYDLLQPPLSELRKPSLAVSCLRGTWASDLRAMLSMKVLATIRDVSRLLTAGALSESVLHDEDFVEVHKQGTFVPGDVEEVRQTPEDALVAAELGQRRSRRGMVTLSEMLWSHRRTRAMEAVRNAGLKLRVVASSARTDRWR